MKNLKYALLLAASVLSAPQAFACYTVYNTANQVIYNAQTPPVDMRYQLHEVVPEVFPAGHMVFGDEIDCPVTSAVYVRTLRPGTGVRPVRAERLRPKQDRN